MAIDTFGVPLAYLIVIAATMWVVVATRGRWWLKGIIVIATVTFSITLWRSLPALQGWPVEAEMPARFEIKWLITEEPGKKTRGSGAVYVWAVDLDAGRAAREPFFLRMHRKGERPEPRLYRLPYSRPLHDQAKEIQDQIRGGKRFFGVMREGVPGEGVRREKLRDAKAKPGVKTWPRGKGEERGRGPPAPFTRITSFTNCPPRASLKRNRSEDHLKRRKTDRRGGCAPVTPAPCDRPSSRRPRQLPLFQGPDL